MTHLMSAALAGTGLLLSGAVASAVTPEIAVIAYTVPAIGTVAEYSTGVVHTVVDVNDAGMVLIEERHPEYGLTYVRYSYGLGRLSIHWNDEAGFPRAVLRAFDEAVFAAAWPLTPGHTARYSMLEVDTDGLEESVAATLTVLDLRPVVTPLGEVTAAVVRLDYDVYGEPDRRNTYDMWFAEGFGLPVRIEMTLDYAGAQPVQDTLELVRVTLPE